MPVVCAMANLGLGVRGAAVLALAMGTTFRWAAQPTNLPPSTGMIHPVVEVRLTTAAITACATPSACTTRFSGVVEATFSTMAVVRPGTNVVSTAAGEIVSTRISGPRIRASDSAMVSKAAFEPP